MPSSRDSFRRNRVAPVGTIRIPFSPHYGKKPKLAAVKTETPNRKRSRRTVPVARPGSCLTFRDVLLVIPSTGISVFSRLSCGNYDVSLSPVF